MYYVGLDCHWRRSSMHIFDQNGKHYKRLSVVGHWPKVMQVIDQSIPRPFAICFEASCGYGYLHDELARRADRVVVAHPGQLRLIFRSKKKHDRIDATKLGKLLFLDEVPAVHVPDLDVRNWRGLIQTRRSLVEKRAACKNQVRSTLRTHGVQTPSKMGLWSKRGRAWLRELPLPPAARVMLELTLGQIDLLSQQIDTMEKELDRIGNAHPGVQVLRTIPGVGMRTAEAVTAYIDQIERFARLRRVGSYFGLVPCQDSSSERNRLGHITRDGPPIVRKLLCEAAHMGIRKSPRIRAFCDQVMRGDPDRKKIAVVATAHYLLRSMAAMLRSGQAWRYEDKKGRPRNTAAGGQRVSPPEDTARVTALSSEPGMN